MIVLVAALMLAVAAVAPTEVAAVAIVRDEPPGPRIELGDPCISLVQVLEMDWRGVKHMRELEGTTARDLQLIDLATRLAAERARLLNEKEDY